MLFCELHIQFERDSVWLCCSSSLCEEQITTYFPEADVGKEVMQLSVLVLVRTMLREWLKDAVNL